MTYVCELGKGQRVYLDYQGTQTIVTTVSSSPGQQQQSSTSFQTGYWTAPPEGFRTPDGIVLKITTVQGECSIHIQGNSMSMTNSAPSFSNAQSIQVQPVVPSSVAFVPPTPMQPVDPMPSMQPMKPMKPMVMGDMQMSMNPMAMRMGNMELHMGTEAVSTPEAGTTANSQRFCSQCGASVDPGDRFCANCGHRLKQRTDD